MAILPSGDVSFFARFPEVRVRPHPLLQRYYATEEERRERVRSWFDESAPVYDRITQAMSFGSSH